MEKRSMVCINCPLGCTLQVESVGDNISVSGNSCKRGIEYARNELTDPKRAITSTMRVIDGEKPVVPVKTSIDIPKKLIMDIMKVINSVTVTAPVKLGDVLIADVLDTGADIVATGNVNLVSKK